MSTTDTELSILSIETALRLHMSRRSMPDTPARETGSGAPIGAIEAGCWTSTTSMRFASVWRRRRRSGLVVRRSNQA